MDTDICVAFKKCI